MNFSIDVKVEPGIFNDLKIEPVDLKLEEGIRDGLKFEDGVRMVLKLEEGNYESGQPPEEEASDNHQAAPTGVPESLPPQHHFTIDPFVFKCYFENYQRLLDARNFLKQELQNEISVKQEIENRISSVVPLIPKLDLHIPAPNPKEILAKRNFEELNSTLSTAPDDGQGLDEMPLTRSKARYSPKTFDPDYSLQYSQNRMKNNQGTIAGKIKRLCQKNKETGLDSKLFIDATANLTPETREGFRQWALKLDKALKTWTALKGFFGSKLEFGMIFLKMIQEFLSPEYKSEYEEWLGQGQMTVQTRTLLKLEGTKQFYLTKFSLIKEELSGNVGNFSSEINKSRKSLKLERPKEPTTERLLSKSPQNCK